MKDNRGFAIFITKKQLKSRQALHIIFLKPQCKAYKGASILYFNASFSDVLSFSKISQRPGFDQQMVNSVVYHPCPSILANRLTLTFIRHLTSVNSNLIKKQKISLLLRNKFKQFDTLRAYSKLQCVFALYVHFSLQ